MNAFRVISSISAPQFPTHRKEGFFMNRRVTKPNRLRRILECILSLPSILVAGFMIFSMLSAMLLFNISGVSHTLSASADFEATDKYNIFINNTISNALDGLIYVEKIYRLSDSDQVAPEPNQDYFGQTEDPSELDWLFEKVNKRLDGDTLMFGPDTKLLEKSSATYYLDDSIYSVTWKQPIRNVVYTFAEVKIEDPSQFRRFMADGVYGSEKQYLTSQMAASVNAVVASAGDFYKYRNFGHVVVNGEVKRATGERFDTCYIDDNGDLLFTRAGEIKDQEQLQKYVDDHDVRFSICFGPVLLEDGISCVPPRYPVGEISGNFSRSALCQLGPLHYLIVTANDEGRYSNFPTLYSFADALAELGVKKAYTLDGGQTATIVMNDKVINRVSYGAERYISDIIYFATAIPNRE